MKSLPRFSVENPVLVGVLMMSIIIGGVYCALTLVREMFPESRPNLVSINVVYPGATPLEIEKGLAIKIEEAIKDIENIDKIETGITEGACSVVVTMTSEADDIEDVVNEFKAAVDAIPRDELPEEAEAIRVAKLEPKLPVISVSLYGDVGERSLKDTGLELRDELALMLPTAEVTLGGTRKAELTVEVQPEKMIEYHLSLAEIAETIRQSNLDLPAGQVKTKGQNVAVRTLGESDEAEVIAETILRTTTDGQVVRVSDVGQVLDDFEDSDIRGRFNSKPAVTLTIYKVGNADAVDIATRAKAFVAGRMGRPMEFDWLTKLMNLFGKQSAAQKIYQQAANNPYTGELAVMVHTDMSQYIEGRLDLVRRNGLWGLVLVFGSLLFFLNWRVAFWVMMGLILSICGTIMLMSFIGESINLISMFGVIIVLGLIVDDAIVVGENIYAHVENGVEPRLAAVQATEEVTWPVIIAVLTTIGAFLPLIFIEGQIGDFMGVLPVVVTCALAVSLLEALSILPCHLAEWLRPVRKDMNGYDHHDRPRHRLAGLIQPIRAGQKALLDGMLNGYEWLLRLAVTYRYVTLTCAVGLLIMAAGLVAGHRVPFVFVQKMDSEMLTVQIEMPVGTPVEDTERVVRIMEEKAITVPEVKTVFTLVGSALEIGETGAFANSGSHLGQAIIELKTIDHRDRSSEEIIAELRGVTNKIAGVNNIRYESMHGGPGGAEIEIEVTGDRQEDILLAANTLKSALADFQGVFDIADDFEEGRREVQIELIDSARPLQITARSLATEIRGAFYGLEARTLQREREDVDIRVRFPEYRRRHLFELEAMRIATPAGNMVPLSEVARLQEGRGYASIRRVDQKRAVVVTADVDQSQGNAEQITQALAPTIHELEQDLPGLQIRFAGNKREAAKSLGSLKRDFVIAILIIYVMLAGLFKSYFQPLIVLIAVPFGLIGAITGHLVMGYPLTILSTIGLVALTGIVVNDALILVDFINKHVAGGMGLFEAIIAGGRRRLRPIILTSLTTVLGLAPMMAETSFQARFLIPMAVSISFGLIFATVLTLLLVPCIYMIMEDLYRLACWLWYGQAPQEASAAS